MKKLIMLLLIVLMISGCASNPNVDKNILTKEYDEIGFKSLIQDEVVAYKYLSDIECVLIFDKVYGKEYRIIGFDHYGIIVVEKRDMKK